MRLSLVPPIMFCLFHALNRYVHTDQAMIESFDQASQLHRAADKYFLTQLMEICTQFMWSDLTADNVEAAVEFGYKYNNSQLKVFKTF